MNKRSCSEVQAAVNSPVFPHKIKFLPLILITLFLSIPTFATEAPGERFVANIAYPMGPKESITPGTLCKKPDEKRYPEGIPYCERAVGGSLKNDIIKTYDTTFGYKIGSMDRKLFKIDHYIPLCMGGSNEEENLWPQHESVYTLTDPIEQFACQKMSEGKLRQKDAVAYIREAKNDLTKAKAILEKIMSL